MKQFKTIILTVCLVAMAAITIEARVGLTKWDSEMNFKPDRVLSENRLLDNAAKTSLLDPFQTIGVHNIGKIGFTVCNNGKIGTGFIGNVLDPVTGLPAPSCKYPYPGKNEYLFAGTLWIGAVVGNDTLVSVGADGWTFVREMWPDPYPEGDIILKNMYDDLDGISEQDIIAVYTDTVTDPNYVAPDQFDGRPHIPLGLEISQKSFAWSYPFAEDFVIMDYGIKNIGQNFLEDVFVGIYVDGDVGDPGSGNHFIDDIAGFKKVVNSPFSGSCDWQDTINLAWIADNDGLNSDETCPYDYDSPTAVTGISVIRTPSESLTMNFNWWISNGSPLLDFGPRKAGTAEDPFRIFDPDFPDGVLGTPVGDRNKYYVMSHPEVDYDQLFSAVDQTADGWLAPGPQAVNFSDGYDTRYLISFGPFNIAPGETLPLTIAYVAGQNFFTDCDAFASFDPYNSEVYYNTLDFSDIGLNAVWASWIYDNPGIDTDGDGFHGKYRICIYDSSFIGGEWVYYADTSYYQGDGVPDFIGTPATVCGDIDGRYGINLLDIIYLIKYIYKDGPAPQPEFAAADVNGDDAINILDIVYFINYKFRDGPELNCIFDGGLSKPYKVFDPVDTAIISHKIENGINKIYVDSPVDLYGLEIELEKTNSTNIELENLIGQMSMFLNQSGDILSLGLVDPVGVNYISGGRQAILTAPGDFRIISALGANDVAEPVYFKIENVTLPESFNLEQNYPNPFNPVTNIGFSLPVNSYVNLYIYDVLGRKIETLISREMEAGEYNVTWNAQSVASGAYFYRLEAGDYIDSKKMLLVK